MSRQDHLGLRKDTKVPNKGTGRLVQESFTNDGLFIVRCEGLTLLLPGLHILLCRVLKVLFKNVSIGIYGGVFILRYCCHLSKLSELLGWRVGANQGPGGGGGGACQCGVRIIRPPTRKIPT